MSKLKVKAEELRNIARELDSVASKPVNAQEMVDRFAPPTCNTDATIDLRIIGRSDMDVRKYVVRNAADRLSIFIAEKLDYEYVGLDSSENFLLRPWECAKYRATIIPFTSFELREYTEKVIRAAREGVEPPAYMRHFK